MQTLLWEVCRFFLREDVVEGWMKFNFFFFFFCPFWRCWQKKLENNFFGGVGNIYMNSKQTSKEQTLHWEVSDRIILSHSYIKELIVHELHVYSMIPISSVHVQVHEENSPLISAFPGNNSKKMPDSVSLFRVMIFQMLSVSF